MPSEPATIVATKLSLCTVGTVGDLIALLQTLDPALHIIVSADFRRYNFLEVIHEKAIALAGHPGPWNSQCIRFDIQSPHDGAP